MGALSEDVIENIANAAIDFHMDRGQVHNQHIQDKPLLDELRRRQKTFPGGKGEITVRTVFDTESGIEGFEGDDTLSFTNPTPIKTARYPWKMIHCGITMTTQELLHDGISVADTNGRQTRNHSQRDVIALANALEVKLEDMSEGYAAGMNEMLWADGSQDSKEVPGIKYMIADDPSTGSVGGIDRSEQPMWRNKALVGEDKVVSDPDKSKLIKELRSLRRQLHRYGRPELICMCGSRALERLEAEVDAKGIYTQSGFSGRQEVGMGEISLNGLGTFRYDPTLDDMNDEDRIYLIDTRAIRLMPIEGEDMKRHYPSRPHDKMVIYRSITWAGGLVARQLNTSAVVETDDPA